MTSTQIVSNTNGRACIPKSSPPATFLLPFGKNVYHVPASAIKSYPKSANEEIKTAEELSALLHTKAPEKWMPYCQPDYLCRIEGETGNCVYTTFEVPGWPDERRFLRLISATVAAKNFEQIKEDALEKAKTVPITKKHQQIRLEVLDWTQGERLPQPRADQPRDREVGGRHGRRAGQVVLQGARGQEAHQARGQLRRTTSRRSASSTSAHEEFVKQPPGTTYKINEVGGLLHVLFYRTAATAVAEDDEDDQ